MSGTPQAAQAITDMKAKTKPAPRHAQPAAQAAPPKRKKTRSKKGPTEPVVDILNRPKRITDDEANQMFQYYCRVRYDGGMARVAKVFKRAVRAVRELAKRQDWQTRIARVQARVDHHTETVVANEQISTLKFARKIHEKTYQRIKGMKNDEFKPSVTDFCHVSRLVDELGGSLPDAGNQTAADPAQVNEALALLRTLSKDDVRILAEQVARSKPANIANSANQPSQPDTSTTSNDNTQNRGGAE